MHAPATVELVVKTSPLPICPWDDMEEQIGALKIWSAPKIWRGYVDNVFVQNVAGLRKYVATQDMSDMSQTCRRHVARHF